MLASGKKDIVKMLVQKMGIFVTTAGDNRDKFRLKTFPRQSLDERCRGRRVGTWLEDHGISGCKRVDQRFDREEKRIVPRTHNKDYPVRNRLLVTARGKLGHRSMDILFFSIFIDISDHMCQFVQDQTGFTHVTFERTFAKVFSKGFVDIFFMGCDPVFQFFQMFDPGFDRTGRPGIKITSLKFD